MSIIMSLGALLPRLFGKQLSDRWTKALGVTLLILGALMLLSLGKCAYDASLIAKHEAAENARKAQAELAADRAADAATAEKAKKLAETQKALEQAQAEAARSDPVGAAKPVGPVTQSYYDTLRKEKK